MRKIKKWKKWSVIIPVLMATLVLALSPTAALAQSDEEATTASRPVQKDGLAIVAPMGAAVGQEISMTVFLRSNQEPFEGAGVWALTRDQAEALRQEMAELTEDSSLTAEEKDYEALADVHGTFIGRTGADGKLYHTFGEAGTYVLVAVKRGYFPGFTSIGIREIRKALAIRAPQSAKVGEEVTMAVLQRGTGEPVEKAGVWAVTRDKVEALKQEMTALRESDNTSAAEEIDYESVADVYGIYLGHTDENGNVSHAFEEAGGYLLVAVKRGYIPGFASIRIGETPKALVIRAPQSAQVGEEVTMTVLQRGTGEPVEKAGVWAVTRDKVDALRQDIASLRDNDSMSAADMDYESVADVYGIYLGHTDENGNVSHAFEEAGGYLLVAVKGGYIPGFASIRIMPLPKAEVLERNGVRGQGLDIAPGLQKPLNRNLQADDNSV